MTIGLFRRSMCRLLLVTICAVTCGCKKPEIAYRGPLLPDSQTATVRADSDSSNDVLLTNFIIIENDTLVSKSTPHNQRLSEIKVLPGKTRAALYWGLASQQSLANKLTSIATMQGLCIISFQTEAGRTYDLQLLAPPDSTAISDGTGKTSTVKCEQL